MSLEPDFPIALSKLQSMSKDELHELFTDESKFDDYIMSLDQMKQLYSEKEMLMASNKSLAEYNLSQEPVLQEKKQAMAEKHRQAIELLSQLKQTKESIEMKSGKVKPDMLYSLLQVAQSEAERESEKLTEDLLDGQITDIDKFLDSFMEKRKIYHLRRIKLDKMKEIIEGKSKIKTPVRAAPKPPGVYPAQQRLPVYGTPYAVTGSIPAPPPNSWSSNPSPGYPASNLPYPLQPTGIPR